MITAAISVAATYFLGAIPGNLITQGFSMLTGQQDKFSWKSLAMSTVTAYVSAGVSNLAQSTSSLVNNAGFAASAARAVATSAVSQGIGVATGLQKKFDWAGVAAAGVGVGVGAEFQNRVLGVPANVGMNFGQQLAAGTASAIANAATRSALKGSSFGDSLLAAIPEVIGQVAGGLLIGGIQTLSRPARSDAPEPEPVKVGTSDTAEGSPDRIEVNEAVIQAAVRDAFEITPEARIDVMEATGDIASDTATALRKLVTEVKTQLRDDYVERQSMPFDGYGGIGSDGLPYLTAEVGSLAIDKGTIDARQSYYEQQFANADGTASVDGLAEARRGYAYNRELVRGWDHIANAQIDRELGGFLASGIVGGGVGAIGSIALGTSWIAGGITAGSSSATSGVPLRWALGQENNAQTFIEDAIKGVVFYGLLRGAGAAYNRLSAPAAESAGARFGGAYATNGELVQSIATRADNWGIRNGLGNGPVVGTAKHGYAETLLNRYQRMFGDRGLTAEARYVDSAPWKTGDSLTGSIRLDVVDGPLANPTRVWDYKFGNATLSQGRTTQIQNGIPNGANVPILMVKP